MPIIAELFDTSIDNLLGYAKECTVAEREAFFKETRNLPTTEKISRYRKMLREYPNDTYLQFGLANLLYGQIKKKDESDVEQEIRLLCNRILHSNYPDMQCGAKRLLALLYAKHGDTEKAMRYVNELPSVYCGREIMAERIMNGVTFREAVEKLILGSEIAPATGSC